MTSLKIIGKCSSCGHVGDLNLSTLSKLIDSVVSITNINQAYDKIICSKCQSKHVCIEDNNGRIIIDPEHLNECVECNCPIEYPRLKAQPDTNVCASCMRDFSEKNKIKTHNPKEVIFDEQLIPDDLKKCGKCSKNTVVRRNRVSDRKFIGCTGFPNCRWTHSLEKNVIT